MASWKKAYESNIWKYYLFRSIHMFMVIMPIIVVFFQDNGLSLTDIYVLQAIFAIAVVIFEVPSGFFSDVLGRKLAIVIGTLLGFAGFLFYSFSYGFWGFLTAELILGFGSSFISGSDNSLVYDSLIKLKRTGDYKKIESQCQLLSRLSEAAAAIAGGFLAIVSLRFPFYIETAIAALCIPVALSLKEPEREAFRHKRGHMYGMYKIIRFAFYKNKTIRNLIMFYAVCGTGTLIATWAFQPYFKLVDINLAYFGILWALVNISVGLFSKLADPIEKRFKKYSLLIIAIAVSSGFFLLGAFVSKIAIVFILFILFARALIIPIVNQYIHDIVWSDKRATVMSLNNLVARLLFAVCGPLVGWAADLYTLPVALMISGIILAVSLLVVFVILIVSDGKIELA